MARKLVAMTVDPARLKAAQDALAKAMASKEPAPVEVAARDGENLAETGSDGLQVEGRGSTRARDADSVESHTETGGEVKEGGQEGETEMHGTTESDEDPRDSPADSPYAIATDESYIPIERLVYCSGMDRAIGYIRVSTQEQVVSGAGLSVQREAIETECAHRGWELVAIEADEGVSGKSMAKRYGLDRAIAAIERGEADVLVVSKLDRLSRSTNDFTTLVARSHKKGWRVVVLDIGMDTTTPVGNFTANLMAAVAQLERELIGQRTAAALAIKRAQGVRLGAPTTVARDVIERIETMRAGGSTYQAIANALNDDQVPTPRGGAQWYPATIRKVANRVHA